MKRPTPADLRDWYVLETRAGYVNLKTIEASRILTGDAPRCAACGGHRFKRRGVRGGAGAVIVDGAAQEGGAE